MSRIDQSVEARDGSGGADFNDMVLTDEPISQVEIEELLYSEAFSREERLGKLQELREILVAREAADFGGGDSRSLLGEVERAISELEDGTGESLEASAVDHNPEDHSETMAPDSDEYLDRMEEEQASLAEDGDLEEVLDETEWEDGDGFDPERGVH